MRHWSSRRPILLLTADLMAAPTFPPGGSPAGTAYHNHNLTLQKYLLLQAQHETLRQHIDQLRPLARMVDGNCLISPVTSPTGASCTGDSSPYASRSSSVSRGGTRRPSLPISPGPRCILASSACLDSATDQSALGEMAIEEARLVDVNEGIKRALTELLNCHEVRSDPGFRTWVQCRLMTTEKELRVGRRRRSAAAFDYL